MEPWVTQVGQAGRMIANRPVPSPPLTGSTQQLLPYINLWSGLPHGAATLCGGEGKEAILDSLWTICGQESNIVED